MQRRRSLSLALGALVGGAGAASARPLRLFADDSYAPLIHLRQGQPTGLLVDLLQRVQALTGERFELELMSWARALSLAMRGLGGVIGASYTEQRATWLDYSEPVYHDDVQILVRKGDAFPFERLTDLRGRTLGATLGASYGEAVDRACRSRLFTLQRDWGVDKRIRMLLAGRTQGALMGSGPAGVALAFELHPELRALRAEVELLPRPLARDPLYLAFPKSLGQRDAVERFNQALLQVHPVPQSQGRRVSTAAPSSFGPQTES